MAKALAQFGIVRTGEDYLITLEDQEGETIEFTVDEDRFDLMIEAIEDQLDSEEDGDLVEDDEVDADKDDD